MEWGNAFNGFMYMTKETVKDILQVLLGSVLFAISLNIFLIPVQVYRFHNGMQRYAVSL